MNNPNNIDLGNVKSRDLGNMAKTLVNLGKDEVKKSNPDLDYGDLPSRTLPEIGKTVIANELDENSLK